MTRTTPALGALILAPPLTGAILTLLGTLFLGGCERTLPAAAACLDVPVPAQLAAPAACTADATQSREVSR